MPRVAISYQFISFDRVKSTLQKRRAKNNPVQPNDLLEIDLEGDFGKTLEYLKFVQYDNKSADNRIIIFGCDRSMDILRRAKIIHIDGTFKACPKNMLQVFTIHAYVYDTFFPCA